MARKIKSACKKTGKRLLKLWGAILAFFLGITGMNCPLYGIAPLYGVPEYGMPYAEFNINGKVKSSSTQVTIPGIKVSALDENLNILNETAYTGVNGDYSVTFTTPGAVDMAVIMRFEDVDGIENGSYNNKDVDVTINQDDYVDDTPVDDWDDGYGSKTVDVDLDPST